MEILHPDHISIKIEENDSDNSIIAETRKPNAPAKRQRKPRYRCKLCPRRYTDEARHMMMFHLATSEFICGTCDKLCPSLDDLKTHERRSHKVKHIQCPSCPASFYSNFHLSRHSKMHTSERPFACDACGNRFRLLSELMSHEIIHSRTLSSINLIKCLECGKGCHNLEVHMLQHAKARTFVCDICQATFRTKEHIRSHMGIHINARCYKCSICCKDFNFRTQLSRHLRIHSQICPFQCETCGKGFKFSGSLTLHKRSHTGEKPYKCERCEKAFSTVMSLKLHTRIHTGNKPYVCPTCGRGFHDGSTMKVHMRQHTGENPYVCHICGKTTKQASNMKSHYRHFHKINDMTSRVIRDNAKILAEKKRFEEAAKQPAMHEVVSNVSQLSKASIMLEITNVLEPIQPSPSPDGPTGVCLNPKTEEPVSFDMIKESILKSKQTQKITTIVKKSKLKISNSKATNSEMKLQCAVNRRRSIEQIVVKEETDSADWCNEDSMHVFEEALPIAEDESGSASQLPPWNNDEYRGENESIPSVLHEYKQESVDSFDIPEVPPSLSPNPPVDLKPWIPSLEMEIKPLPRKRSSKSTSRTSKSTGNKYQNCSICPKRFLNYNNHMQRWHSVSPAKSFECEQCHKVFRSSGNLQSHIVLHTNQKNVICEQCGAAFYFQTDLRRHMRSHSDVRPFKCDLCGKTFKDLGQTRTHMRSHSGIKPFECTLCEKTFVSTMGLHLHLRVHTGEKPYHCDYCGSAFADNSTYKQHLRIHTGERPYQCHLCGKGTTQAGNLKSHLRHFHKLIVKHVQKKK